METIDYNIDFNIAPYVNCVMTGRNEDPRSMTSIPIYADGYPGIMYQKAEQGFYLLPRNKKLSGLFLYGQTLAPISLNAKGPFSFIVFQLYPFAPKQLLGIDPKILNDDCYDLLQLKQVDIASYWYRLIGTVLIEEQMDVLTELVAKLLENNAPHLNTSIRKAIDLIVINKGQMSIAEVQEAVHMTERTLERQFLSETGLSPKQFSRIIQFQSSCHLLNEANFDKMVEVGYDSGFSDQSHFIRTFKKYTGLTPSAYMKQTG